MMNANRAAGILARFWEYGSEERATCPPIGEVIAAAERLRNDPRAFPFKYRLHAHPVMLRMWGEAAHHVLWHMRNPGTGPGLSFRHPPEAFRGPVPSSEHGAPGTPFAIVEADPDTGTVTIVYADDSRWMMPHEQAADVAAALAAGRIPVGELEP